jgi:phosphatidylglycerol:prolipoprotein diacylglycerol transferase
MRPVLCEWGSLKFHAYPTMLAVAFLTATFLAVRALNRLDPPVRATTHGGLAAFFGGLIGAKAFWILQYDDPWKVWQAVLFWTPGFVFYGGLIGAIGAVLVYVLYNRFPVLRTADACAPYVALGEAITRVGCFLTGCCWGRETRLPWAMCFPKASSAHWYMRHADPPTLDSADAFTPALHPTQLYMCLGLLLVVFPVLLYAGRKPHFRGAIALMYLFFYGVLRFAVEAYRGDSGHPAFGMTLSQAISLGLAVFSLVAFALIKSTIFVPRPEQPPADRIQD